MDVLVHIMEIVLCLYSLFLISVVLLQSGRSAGLAGDIAGGAESFLGKSKAKGYEGTLKKLTKVAAVGMMVLAVALVLIQVYFMGDTSGTDVLPTATPAPLTNPSESVSAETSEEATVEATVSAETSATESTEPSATPAS